MKTIRQFTLLLFIGLVAMLLKRSGTKVTPKWPALSNLHLLGQPAVSENQIVTFLIRNNSSLSLKQAQEIAKIYCRESRDESINLAIAVAQMALETGFLRFSGVVRGEQNNFSGLGCARASDSGARFKTPNEGIRAQVQHLKAYASRKPLKNACVDPRRKFVEKSKSFGNLKTVYDLAGIWAMDKQYGEKLAKLTHELLQTEAHPLPALTLSTRSPNTSKRSHTARTFAHR